MSEYRDKLLLEIIQVLKLHFHSAEIDQILTLKNKISRKSMVSHNFPTQVKRHSLIIFGSIDKMLTPHGFFLATIKRCFARKIQLNIISEINCTQMMKINEKIVIKIGFLFIFRFCFLVLIAENFNRFDFNGSIVSFLFLYCFGKSRMKTVFISNFSINESGFNDAEIMTIYQERWIADVLNNFSSNFDFDSCFVIIFSLRGVLFQGDFECGFCICHLIETMIEPSAVNRQQLGGAEKSLTHLNPSKKMKKMNTLQIHKAM